MKRLFIALFLIAILLNFGSARSEESICQPTDEMARLVSLHNQARSKGLRCEAKKLKAPVLVWNCALMQAAKRHAAELAKVKKLSHQSEDGTRFSERVTQAGFAWISVAENIGFGYRDAATAHQAWSNSREHCLNLMSTDYNSIGAARSGDYWVVVFAR